MYQSKNWYTSNQKKIMKKGISTKLRNLMKNYIGKTFNIVYCGRIIWTSKIVGLMGDTGYFITEINDGQKSWQSNASYGEITNGIKKGQYVEV